jgi:hypothetical protein
LKPLIRADQASISVLGPLSPYAHRISVPMAKQWWINLLRFCKELGTVKVTL